MQHRVVQTDQFFPDRQYQNGLRLLQFPHSFHGCTVPPDLPSESHYANVRPVVRVTASVCTPFNTVCLPLNYSGNPGVKRVSYRDAMASAPETVHLFRCGCSHTGCVCSSAAAPIRPVRLHYSHTGLLYCDCYHVWSVSLRLLPYGTGCVLYRSYSQFAATFASSACFADVALCSMQYSTARHSVSAVW